MEFFCAGVALIFERLISHMRSLAAAELHSGAPHLLELHSDLVECLGDDGYENVFHQPGEKEDHSAEVEHRPPPRQRVNRSVHDENPALLGGRLIHGENRCG